MQQATQTANRYLSLLLAGTSLWMLATAVVSHFTLSFALIEGPLASQQSGLTASWRWWLLCLLSVTLYGTTVLLGRVGKGGNASDRVFFGLLSLTVLWSAALAISGGAANAANAIQLILIAAAFMTLPAAKAWVVFAVVAMVQSSFLLSMLASGHQHTHDMVQGADMGAVDLHYIGMSLTFLVAALLLALTISRLQRSLQLQQREAQAMREAQLRQEQVLAMATASAQITHELATPLATIGMLYDELAEDFPQHSAITELHQPIQQVKELLQYLRAVAVDIQGQQQQTFALGALEQQLQQQVSLNFSAALVNWQLGAAQPAHKIQADMTLIPALLGLIRNALTASEHVDEHALCEVSSEVVNATHWRLTIKNPTSAAAQTRLQTLQGLGLNAVQSERGLGFGILLSHATLERFHGDLHIRLDDEGYFHQVVTMPLLR